MTGTFTYDALHMKTLKELIKTQKNCHSNGTRAMLGNVIFSLSIYISVGMYKANEGGLSLVGLVWFARFCGKMFIRHLFPYGGFL